MKSAKQLALFLTVGSLSAVVNFFTFYIVWSLLGVSYLIASSVAYFLSVVTHFLGNRYYTFQTRHLKLAPQLKKYGLVLAINYCITLMVISTSVKAFHLSPYIGTILAIGSTVMIGFLLSQRWVFHDKEI